MEEFVENFNEFKEFLNAPNTQHAIKIMIGPQGEQALDLIKKRFHELGLNEAF